MFNESLDKMRYTELQTDRNRSRWQDNELWVELRKVYDGQLSKYRSGVIPRLRTHNQNMTVAARAIAERKTVGDLS